MRKRTIAGVAVTAIGSGDVSLKRSAARGVDGRALERATHHALSLGITLVDVAAEPDAEQLVGDAIRALRLRDQVVASIHVPRLHDGVRRDVLIERLPPGHVQQRVEHALRATRLDAIPVASLDLSPSWIRSTAWPELAGTCARLIREGKVVTWGARVAASDDLDAVIAEPWIAAISVPFSLCDRDATATTAITAAIAAMGQRDGVLLARHPLAGGALAGQLGPGVKLAPGDDRLELDDAALAHIATEIARLAPLVRDTPPAATSCDAAKAALAGGRRPDHVECMNLAELALRYVIDHGAIALPRLHREATAREAVGAAAAPALSAGLRQHLAPAVDPPES